MSGRRPYHCYRTAVDTFFSNILYEFQVIFTVTVLYYIDTIKSNNKPRGNRPPDPLAGKFQNSDLVTADSAVQVQQ